MERPSLLFLERPCSLLKRSFDGPVPIVWSERTDNSPCNVLMVKAIVKLDRGPICNSSLVKCCRSVDSEIHRRLRAPRKKSDFHRMVYDG